MVALWSTSVRLQSLKTRERYFGAGETSTTRFYVKRPGLNRLRSLIGLGRERGWSLGVNTCG
jgi:hypothetical protein